MAAGPIPLSEMLAYCRLFEVSDQEEIAELVYMVGQLDDEYLGWMNEKN